MSRPDPSLLHPADLIHIGRRPWALYPIEDYGISRSIQSLTAAPVSHTMIVTEVGKTPADTKIIEAHYPAVHETTLEAAIPHFGTRWFVRRHLGVEPLNYDAIVGWLRRQVGDPYDVNLIVKMREAVKQGGLDALHQLRIRLAVQDDGSINPDGDFWICSELGAACFQTVGLSGFTGYDASLPIQQVSPPTPGMLLECDLYEKIAEG